MDTLPREVIIYNIIQHCPEWLYGVSISFDNMLAEYYVCDGFDSAAQKCIRMLTARCHSILIKPYPYGDLMMRFNNQRTTSRIQRFITENEYNAAHMNIVAANEILRSEINKKHGCYKLSNSIHLITIIRCYSGFSRINNNRPNIIDKLPEKIQFGEFMERATNMYEMMCGSKRRFKIGTFSHGPSCSNCGNMGCMDDCTNSNDKHYSWSWKFSEYTDETYQTN